MLNALINNTPKQLLKRPIPTPVTLRLNAYWEMWQTNLVQPLARAIG